MAASMTPQSPWDGHPLGNRVPDVRFRSSPSSGWCCRPCCPVLLPTELWGRRPEGLHEEGPGPSTESAPALQGGTGPLASAGRLPPTGHLPGPVPSPRVLPSPHCSRQKETGRSARPLRGVTVPRERGRVAPDSSICFVQLRAGKSRPAPPVSVAQARPSPRRVLWPTPVRQLAPQAAGAWRVPGLGHHA